MDPTFCVFFSDSEIAANVENARNNRDPDDERHVAFAPLPGKAPEVPPIIGDERGVSHVDLSGLWSTNISKTVLSVRRKHFQLSLFTA